MQQTILYRKETEKARRLREEAIALKNRRLGMSIFQISWIMAFVCLILVNWQLRSAYSSWPPPGNEPPNSLIAAIATIALLSSTILAHKGMKALQNDRRKNFFRSWRPAIALGLFFLIAMVYQFFGVTMDDTQYGNIFRVMIGYHAIHALAIGAMMILVHQRVSAGQYDAANSWMVEGVTRLWHFVTIAWILFYIVLYLL